MRILSDASRPAEISCNEIWELYKMLNSLERPYVRYRTGHGDKEYHEKIWHIKHIGIGTDDMVYYHDPIGMDLPERKYEWVRLYLDHMENGEEKTADRYIRVNVMYKNKRSVSDLLTDANISLPTDSEINATEFQGLLPIDNYPVKLEPFRPKDARESMLSFMSRALGQSSYTHTFGKEKDSAFVRIAFITDNVPGGITEGYVRFRDKAAAVRVSYSGLMSELYKNSKHKEDFLHLLNFINARMMDVTACSCDSKNKFPAGLCVLEDSDCQICINSVFNYEVWQKEKYTGYESITEYYPRQLALLSPYLIDVLKGDMSATEAEEKLKAGR